MKVVRQTLHAQLAPPFFGLLFLAYGCTTPIVQHVEALPVVAKVTPADELPRELSTTALSALQEAEKSIALARRNGALWVQATEALVQAHSAAQQLDSEAVLRFAELARVLANLGLQQQHYAPLKVR